MKILRYLPLLLLGASLGFAQPATTPYLSDSMSLQRYGTNGQQYFPTITLLQLQGLFAASQNDVNAGTSTTEFVTPATLNGWGGGGALGTMAKQNANAVNITGGTITGTPSGTVVTFLGETIMGGGVGNGGYFAFAPSPMPALAIDVTQMWNTVTLTGSDTGHPNEVLSFTGTTGTFVQTFSALIYNSDSVVHNPTYPSSFSYNTGSTRTTLTIQPAAYVLLTWYYDGTTYYLKGDPVYYNNLTSKSTPVTADIVAIGDSAANYVTKGSTIAQFGPVSSIKSLTFNLNGSGNALTTGLKTGTYIKVPYAGTIIGWALIVSPSGSITIDIDGAPNNTGLPSSSIIGSGTKPATASAVENSSTTTTNWTTAITALENFAVNVTAADGIVSQATLVLYYQ